MAHEPLPVVYTPEFKRNLRQFAKKYRHIREDIAAIIDQLAAGGTPGDQITGVGYEVYKVRGPNSDARKSKSGGYRVIYHVKPTAPAIRGIIAVQETSKGDVSE